MAADHFNHNVQGHVLFSKIVGEVCPYAEGSVYPGSESLGQFCSPPEIEAVAEHRGFGQTTGSVYKHNRGLIQ